MGERPCWDGCSIALGHAMGCPNSPDAPRELLSIWIPGLAETKGSWRCSCRGGKPRLYADNDREEAWALTIAWSIRAKLRTFAPTTKRCAVTARWVLPKPFRNKNKRDLDKLLRSALDACTKLVWVDDEQVDEAHVYKRISPFGDPIDPIGMQLVITEIEE